ncbi:sine oculis-binding protein homolog B [Patella vulgata]|uniref:sine oculis-binding protein homolog B n=1 Tax=Patella vulgata TaxID=6465 RepID=UPI0024A8A3E6|nr:sine oculis-binding protein homolog B [Patella vulgata]
MDKDRRKTPQPKDITIKQEPSDDIKNYAETTMNELLGWYGYDGVSSMETEHLNLTKYRSNSSKERRRHERKHDDSGDDSDGSMNTLPDDDDDDDDVDDEDDNESIRSCEPGETSLAAQHRNLVSALNKRQDASPGSIESPPSPQYIVCAWCQKPGLKLFTLKSPSGVKPFCSELCFTQCRRASFKKNKICDWCKHVRHTVNYVEFQDGDLQYQFCSQKCLSQYKMNIFCRETQEHLNKIKSKDSEENNNCDVKEKHILITPDLWLKDRGENKSPMDNKMNSVDSEPRTKSSAPPERSSTITSQSENKVHLTARHSRSMSDIKPVERRRDKHRSSTLLADSRDSLSATSPSNSSQISPKPAHLPPLPGVPYMPPWVPPPHLLNGMGPGMMNPLLYGMMGPYGPPIHLPQSATNNKSENRIQTTSPMGQNSVSPATSTGSLGSSPPAAPNMSGFMSGSRHMPPFLPVGYPPFPFPQFNNGELPFGEGGIPMPPQNNPFPVVGSGTLPVTVMVPYPVVLPVPVPIPLPLPITAEKLEQFFKDKAQEEADKQKCSTGTRSDNINRSQSAEPRSTAHKQDHMDECLQCASCNSGSDRTTSRNSVDMGASLRRESYGEVYSHKLKRSLTPNISPVSSVLKKSKLTLTSDSDGAIDLSKDRKDTVGKENCDLTGTNGTDSKRLSDKTDTEYMLKVPRIHIVNPETTSQQTLAQSLPLPPSENPYSNRRSLILDAPNIPKREDSPSPERRYVRTVSRDMVDAARRRCLRARVKTK